MFAHWLLASFVTSLFAVLGIDFLLYRQDVVMQTVETTTRRLVPVELEPAAVAGPTGQTPRERREKRQQDKKTAGAAAAPTSAAAKKEGPKKDATPQPSPRPNLATGADSKDGKDGADSARSQRSKSPLPEAKAAVASAAAAAAGGKQQLKKKPGKGCALPCELE